MVIFRNEVFNFCESDTSFLQLLLNFCNQQKINQKLIKRFQVNRAQPVDFCLQELNKKSKTVSQTVRMTPHKPQNQTSLETILVLEGTALVPHITN